MSTFNVTIRKLDKVWNHPNADRLDLAQVEGCAFQFVVGRNEYRAGDEVLYFPVDSVLQPDIIEALGLTGKLSGKEKNRIKTVRLRGEISQGVVCRRDIFFGPSSSEFQFRCGDDWKNWTPEEITKALKVVKYDPPSVPCKSAKLVHMPDMIGVYDIEGADQFPDVVDALMGEKVYISEKLEGMNFWISCAPCMVPYASLPSSYRPEISVGQRHHEIQPIEGAEHDFWRVAKAQGLDRFVHVLAADIFTGMRVTARGEYLGPGSQGNIYKLPENKVYIFDIMINDEYLRPDEYLSWCRMHDVPTPPLLARDVLLKDWLIGRTIRQASTGESKIACMPNVLREGIVIKPMVEARHDKVGRLFIKQRSPEYLAENDL